MKALDIIEQLTRDDYAENSGVITIEKGERFSEVFMRYFGEDYEDLYEPHTLAFDNTKDHHFLYIYDNRFDGKDSEIYAIFNCHDSSIVTLYEIE